MKTKLFTLANKPESMVRYRKKSTAEAVFITEPFRVDTQEGEMLISPGTVTDWEGGYWLVYPDDGSKPYSWSPSFKESNYMEEAPRDANHASSEPLAATPEEAFEGRKP